MEHNRYNDYWFRYTVDTNPEEIKKTIREEYFNFDGLDIHVDVYDSEPNPKATVIFVHGTAVYSRFYGEFCYLLHKRGYRVVAPDLIGHGLSEGHRGHFTMEQLTLMLCELTSNLIEKHDDNIVIMGSSLGGITALYCLAKDERLKAAVCHNAAIFNEDAYKKIIKMSGIFKLFAPLVPFFSKLFPKLKLSVWNYLDLHNLAKTEELLSNIDYLLNDPLLTTKYTLTSLKTQMRAKMSKPIEQIKTPIMLINGDEDVLFSVEYMNEIYQRIGSKQSKLEVLENASHLIFQENIQESLEKIVPWLEKVI